ncbi:MAG: hypothetical protein HKN44_08475 [Ilumatobacter sp.]|nr:hypothetical protein [Ilumatobacter sp.]
MGPDCDHPHPGAAGFARRTPTAAGALVMIVLGIALAGCFTGARPGFEDSAGRDLTGRREIDAVLVRLDAAPLARFTAEYDILTRLGDRQSTAVVVQADNSRRSITINDVRYLFDEATVATCRLDEGTCVAQITPEATYGELFVDHDFYAATPATRLRNDARSRIGEPVASEIVQAGQTALCVDIPVSGGTTRYCALQTGVLAVYEGNDLEITLTRFLPEPDDALFGTG